MANAAPGVIDGREARTNVDNLTKQVYWFSNLRDAEDSARQKASHCSGCTSWAKSMGPREVPAIA
jgi:hypothetical protein